MKSRLTIHTWKPYVDSDLMGTPIPLYFHQRTEIDEDALPDEWEVDEIVDHKRDSKGNLLFLTKWKGYPLEDNTWEPTGNFIHRYSSDFVKYCR
jgi:Chromo (CHRromatin Organisation MOdifier) domain